MLMEADIYKFWKRVDILRGQVSLKELSEKTGIKYTRIRDGRSLCRSLTVDDAVKISDALGVSVNFLMTGKEDMRLSPEASFVMQNEAARLLIRRVMEDPQLLDALAAVAALAVTPGESKEKNA